MGVFFKPTTAVQDPVEAMFRDVLTADALSPADAEAAAKTKAAAAKGAGAVEPNLTAFVAAGAVFLVLLIAAYVVAQAALTDGGDETAMDTLATAVRELLVAWSAAVLGLIGGEAVGSKG